MDYTVVIEMKGIEKGPCCGRCSSRKEAERFLQGSYVGMCMILQHVDRLVPEKSHICTEKGEAKVYWTEGIETIYRIVPYTPAEHNEFSSLDMYMAYELYKRQWCRTRGWKYEAVKAAAENDEEYQGQMYVCFPEFIECEFQDDAYIDALLNDHELIAEFMKEEQV